MELCTFIQRLHIPAHHLDHHLFTPPRDGHPLLPPQAAAARGNPEHRKKKKPIGMASLAMGFGATAAAGGRGAALAATAATKSAGGSSEKKGLLDWILGGLQKDQLVETDPILNKVEDKNGGTASRSRGGTTSVTVPKKNSGGFGGLFAKK